MKSKEPRRVERRRPLVELNLISDKRQGVARLRRSGCLSFLSRSVLVIAIAGVVIAHH